MTHHSGRIIAVSDGVRGMEEAKTYLLNEYEAINEKLGNTYKNAQDIAWTEHDEFIMVPLLPYSTNEVPLEMSSIHVFKYNTERTSENIFYISLACSQPQKLEYESYQSNRAWTSKGNRNLIGKPIDNFSSSDGVFSNPNDIAIDGRINTDIIQSNNEVLLRAGKFNVNEKDPDAPMFNVVQSNIQINSFEESLTLSEEKKPEKYFDEATVNYYIEYDINDLEPPFNLFSGSISLYEIITDKDKKIMSNDVGLDTDFTTVSSSNWRMGLDFTDQPMSAATNLVNRFLKEAKEGTLDSVPHKDHGPYPSSEYSKRGLDELGYGTATPNTGFLNSLPAFYFLPGQNLQDTFFDSAQPPCPPNVFCAYENAKTFLNRVNLVPVKFKWHGLVFSKENVKAPEKERIKTSIKEEYDKSKKQGITTILSDNILLYSHSTDIPDTEVFNPLSVNTNSPKQGDNIGIDQVTLMTLKEKSMEPLVRGDQLIKLLNKIVDFLVTHEHGWPGTKPKDKKDGVSIEEIQTDLVNAKNTILNQNIRIN